MEKELSVTLIPRDGTWASNPALCTLCYKSQELSAEDLGTDFRPQQVIQRTALVVSGLEFMCFSQAPLPQKEVSRTAHVDACNELRGSSNASGGKP